MLGLSRSGEAAGQVPGPGPVLKGPAVGVATGR